MKNGTHSTGGRESTRLVNEDLSDLWKIPTPEGHIISEPFRPKELANALRCVKSGKSLGLDSIFAQFIHVWWTLKSWFCDFFSSYMRRFEIPKIWRRALIVAIPKPEKPLGYPKSYRPISLLCAPVKTHQHSCRINHRPTAISGAGGLPIREVGQRLGHPANTGHRG